MKTFTWSLCIIYISIIGIFTQLDAFDTNLTQKQIQEAIDYGAKYKGKEILGSDIVKKACFGDYPTGEGGLIMSKYIHTAIISAMMNMNDKTLSDEDKKSIEESTTFDVVVVISDEDVKAPEEVQIILIQGTNNILPQKAEFGMKRKDNKQGIVGVFQQDRVDADASTTITVKTRNVQKKYKIDFSDVK